jgi:hypothetical protein
MQSLREIFNTNLTLKSDKWVSYFDVYETYFSKYRNTDFTFVEVGVSGGGSMQMWREYFGNQAKIVGIDIDPATKELPLPSQDIIIGDQSSIRFWDETLPSIGTIDAFLDDGGHTMVQQINTLVKVWPFIIDGGVYICEDTHTSYWLEYGGGHKRHGSIIEYTKDLIDLVNLEGNPGVLPTESLLNNFPDVRSVHYYHSMIVLIKGKTPLERVIVNQDLS